MKTISYQTIDKSEWERGEWDNEPDKIQWQDEETGYPCLIRRVQNHGALCGYVGINKNHPLFEKNWIEEELNLEVHGGINFSDHCSKNNCEENSICHKVEEGEDDNVWWLGFDCIHAGDKSPLKNLSCIGYNYRNIKYVENEVKSLARQLKEIANKS